MPKPITHVATTDIKDMMSPEPGRRMDLPGFDDEFVDFPHYIVRITERIWHDRDVDLCLKWYTDDCLIHTLSGDIVGAKTVVDNTWATLKSFPDRRLDADNVIWSDEGQGDFYSSHLITSKMTNAGDSEFGPATGRKVLVRTIADCLCRGNKIFREWLVRDNYGLVLQLGFDADTIARSQAQRDKAAGFNLLDFHHANWTRTRELVRPTQTVPTATELCVKALRTLWQNADWKAVNEFYDFRVDARYPGAQHLYGPDEVADFMRGIQGAISNLAVSIDHTAEIDYLGDTKDVAIRWSLAGHHTGAGRYDGPTGAPIYILGVSQFRVINGRIREEYCVWDDVAVRRQIETARL